jgi:hypothetical protein
MADWQTQSVSQHEFYDSLPRRIVGNLLSVASGAEVANAIRSELPATPESEQPPAAPQPQ